MLSFNAPTSLNGEALTEELEAAGYSKVFVVRTSDGLDIEALTSGDNPIGEQSRSAIQTVIDAHTGQPTAAQTRPLLVQQKIDTAIAQIRNELSNWPADLPNNANAATIAGRVNQMAAQLRRNTERIGKLAQLARGLYDVEE